MTKNKYQLFVDLDGVIVDFIGGTLPIMNNKIREVAGDVNLFKTKYPQIYKSVKKAVVELDGNLNDGNMGKSVELDDIKIGTSKKKVRDLMYALVSNNLDFWTNLDWMPDGKQLWSYVQQYNPTILTGPMGPNSKRGKLKWCSRELGLGKNKVVITHTKHEEVRTVLKKGLIPVLIDDLPKYVVPFSNAGGIAIHHSNAATTIEELQKIGL